MPSPVVAVALSGGIDSLVSGYLIKKQFREVFGLHFVTGYESAPVDLDRLAAQLNFPVYRVDLSRAFEQEVVQYFISTYLAGQTPNPCVICNQKIKFGALMDHAVQLGADALATGHYATVINRYSSLAPQGVFLEKGHDPQKNQSYFLSMLCARQLERAIFPLARMTKARVREVAQENGLVPAAPSESQDICFIRNQTFADFINQKQGLTPEPGPIVDPCGNIVGTHNGLHTFTIGQRRGINVPAEAPYYVQGIDMATNTLRVCFKQDLARTGMRLDSLIWHSPADQTIRTVTTQIRYGHKGATSTLEKTGRTATVTFHTPQNAVTPGQTAVFYKKNRVLGAGIIQT